MNDKIDGEGCGLHAVQPIANFVQPRLVSIAGSLIEGREGSDDAGSAGLYHEIGA
jgi:hypothetical protein